MKIERNLLVLANILLTFAWVLLIHMDAFAQSDASLRMPAHLSRDPAYWYSQYQAEQERAALLSKSGRTAIDGLRGSLDQANTVIDSLSQQIDQQAAKAKEEQIRADIAESAAVTLRGRLVELEGRQPKTWAGRQLRKLGSGAKNVLAGIGAATVVVGTTLILLR